MSVGYRPTPRAIADLDAIADYTIDLCVVVIRL
jgi:plasmid stabilization system protein ParE